MGADSPRLTTRHDPLYFGEKLENRCDDPRRRFGVMYVAETESGALRRACHERYADRNSIRKSPACIFLGDAHDVDVHDATQQPGNLARLRRTWDSACERLLSANQERLSPTRIE